jgi:hypothetical protein
MTYEAIITTIGEPQTEACITAAEINKYDRVTLVENISPNSEAHNVGVHKAKCDYITFLDADMELYDNALQTIKQTPFTQSMFSYVMWLDDWFLGIPRKGVRTYNRLKAKEIHVPNCLGMDRRMKGEMKHRGWHELESRARIGWHFKHPTDEQVIRRFLMRGIKSANLQAEGEGSKYLKWMSEKFASTGNRQYILAREAFMYGKTLKHDADYDMHFYKDQYHIIVERANNVENI